MSSGNKWLLAGLVTLLVLIYIFRISGQKEQEKTGGVVYGEKNLSSQEIEFKNVFEHLKNIVDDDERLFKNINSLKIQIGDELRKPGVNSKELEHDGWLAIKALDGFDKALVEARYAVVRFENAPPSQKENASEKILEVADKLVEAREKSKLACALFFVSVGKNPK